MLTKQRYIILHGSDTYTIVDNLEDAYKKHKYNPSVDKVYILGAQVGIKISVETYPLQPITRNALLTDE